jgi:hypothetical protein
MVAIGAPIALALDVAADLVDPAEEKAPHSARASTMYLRSELFEADLCGTLTVTNRLCDFLSDLVLLR